MGQNNYEEIDFEPAGMGGLNYGWRIREGMHDHSPGVPGSTAVLTEPVSEYSHASGCSVSGGYVYRGSSLPGLRGFYLYGDYCSGSVWRITRNGPTFTSPVTISGLSAGQVVGFGQDNAGELYICDLAGRVLKIEAQ